MAKKALIILAPGYEELEAVAVVDILRRAGIDVTIAAVEPGPVSSARNVRIVPDVLLEDTAGRDFDLVVLPGGLESTETLAANQQVISMLKRQLANQGLIGAICAAPTILDRHGLSTGRTITCHPVCRDAVRHADISEERVVEDGLVVTSQGPGTAVEFALRLVERLEGPGKMKEVNKGVLARL